jgi:phosphohistidine phosphatase
LKKLILLRHAKSDWNDVRLSDHDRTLNDRGAQDAPFVAKWLASHTEAPDTIMVSTAVRAQETAQHFIAAFSLNEENVLHLRDIYEAGLEDLINIVSWFSPEDSECVMVVGHNPTMTMALSHLSSTHIVDMPTCCVAVIEFPDATSWKGLGTGELVFMETPKTLRAKE